MPRLASGINEAEANEQHQAVLFQSFLYYVSGTVEEKGLGSNAIICTSTGATAVLIWIACPVNRYIILQDEMMHQ
jgi:quinolinate synthase